MPIGEVKAKKTRRITTNKREEIKNKTDRPIDPFTYHLSVNKDRLSAGGGIDSGKSVVVNIEFHCDVILGLLFRLVG